MISPQLIIALVIAACSFGSAWKIQDWRMDAREKAHVEQTLADQRLAAAQAAQRQQEVANAQNAATQREVALRRDAAGSRTALVGLSGAVDQALRDATASQAACIDRATAIGKLLDTSADQYRSLAETTDRHASDVKTLMDAWPR